MYVREQAFRSSSWTCKGYALLTAWTTKVEYPNLAMRWKWGDTSTSARLATGQEPQAAPLLPQLNRRAVITGICNTSGYHGKTCRRDRRQYSV